MVTRYVRRRQSLRRRGSGQDVVGVAAKMNNPNNYAIIKSSAKENGPAGASTRLQIRKRGAANWTLPVPEASFDSEDKKWEDTLTVTVKRSGESVEFSAKDLERLRAEANRVLHPTVKARD